MNTTEIFKWFEDVKGSGGRTNFESIWKEIATYCMPTRDTITKQTPGAKPSSKIFDGTAIYAIGIFAAGLHSYLTSPTQKWFSLGIKTTRARTFWRKAKAIVQKLFTGVDADENIKLFLKNAEDEIFEVLSESNFNLEIFETYMDLVTLATAILAEEEDEKDFVRFHCHPVSECHIVENERGEVDTIFRKFEFTARQADQQWGSKAGETVSKALEAKDYTKKIEFLHVVTPRDVRDPKKTDNLNKPFASYYYEVSKKHLIEEGGYEEFPFFTVRYSKTSLSQYGYSPAMQALADIKMLNLMSRTLLSAAQKMVSPPLQAPNQGFTMPINISAKGMNYYDLSVAQQGGKIEPLYQTNYQNIPVGREMEMDRREMIKQAFYVDLFLLLAQRTEQKTLGEANMLIEEKMMVLSPVLGRLMNELLKPIIIRTFNILVRKGRIEVPKELENVEYDITYISPLAKMQKISSIRDLDRFGAILNNIAATHPEVVDNVNPDEWLKVGSDLFNITPKLFRTKEEVKQIRDDRAEQQAIAQQMAEAKMMAGIYKEAAQGEAAITPKKEGGKNG